METIGWLSKHAVLFQEAFPAEEYTGAKLDKKGSTGNITFSRRYLDTNTVTYEVSYLVLLGYTARNNLYPTVSHWHEQQNV
jgi:hypothetical protein